MRKIVLSVFLILSTTILAQCQYTNLLHFPGNGSGYNPYGSLYLEGNYLYGMTIFGGIDGLGTVFKIKTDGTGFVQLMDFEGGPNGSNPYGYLISDGNYLYGMTEMGGLYDQGVIFKITYDGNVWLTILNFDGTNGSYPFGSLFSDGTYLYGMTEFGGINNQGTVFKILTDGNGYEKLLDFADSPDGANPWGSLMSDGTYLYGMTGHGGVNDLGTIFKIKPDGTGYQKLLDFNGNNGAYPMGSLISDGNFLYGTTSSGGINQMGNLFKIMPDGTGFTTLFDFSGLPDGSIPYADLFYDGTFLYGTTFGGGLDSGTIFKIKPDGTGFTRLFDFTGLVSGGFPNCSLVSDGTCFYGTTIMGGTNDMGTIFKYQYATIGMEENNPGTDVDIYPNPTTGIININSTKGHENVTLELTNMFGQVIVSIKDIHLLSGENYILDISSYAAGAYILHFNNYRKVIIKE